jgi:hypothetical protein
MKRSFHIVVVALFVILALGSIAESVTAKEQGPFAEFRLTAGDPSAEDGYGRSVAIDGDLVAVGVGDDGATGAVYLYKRQGMTYVPEAKLVALDATGGAEFGRTVAIKGNTVFVGARFAQVGDYPDAGAVYIYKKYRGSWYFKEKIISPEPENEDNFGRAVAVQGNLLVVTARKSGSEEGAAYLYLYKGGSWVYTGQLLASDPVPYAYFGQSVALQGGIMAIGARNAEPNVAGALYIFRQSKDGWEEIAKMAPPDGEEDDQFGFSVAMSGKIIAVGARRANPEGIDNAGAVYLYSVEGKYVELITKLTASDASKSDEFGQSVAIAGDTILVGARRDDVGSAKDQGSIYLFRRINDQWIEGKVLASDGVAGDGFGYSLSAFGNRMLTGASGADDGAGAAYVLPVKY